MNIEKQTHPEFHTGGGTVGTTPERLPTMPVYRSVRIKALAGNAGTLYVDSYPLAAGEEVRIEIDRLEKVTVRGSEAGTGYRWLSV
jgi:hypothetical protein